MREKNDKARAPLNRGLSLLSPFHARFSSRSAVTAASRVVGEGGAAVVAWAWVAAAPRPIVVSEKRGRDGQKKNSTVAASRQAALSFTIFRPLTL